MLQERKSYHDKIEDLKFEIFQMKTQKKWNKCVQHMIEMHRFIEDDLKVELSYMNQKDHKYNTIVHLVKEGQKKLQAHCQDICEDFNGLFKFAYELRIQDCRINKINRADGDREDRYTKAFLRDNLKPKVLYDIIISNKYNEHDKEEEEFSAKPNYNFQLSHDQDILTYQEHKKGEWKR